VLYHHEHIHRSWSDQALVSKRTEFIIEWTSTAILIVGVALTAWNIYPLNVWLSLAGNFGWFVIGWIWRKYSLLTIQIVVTIIYLMGLMQHYGVGL
jgi:uncharacterized membrane protein